MYIVIEQLTQLINYLKIKISYFTSNLDFIIFLTCMSSYTLLLVKQPLFNNMSCVQDGFNFPVSCVQDTPYIMHGMHET